MTTSAPNELELLREENHRLRERVATLEKTHGGLLLPGWFCAQCQVFNGEAKMLYTHCRCCGSAKP